MADRKICILTTVHPPFDVRIFHKECKTLANAGYDVTLIAQHNRNEIVDGVKIIALQKAKKRIHRMFGLTFKAFRLALKQRADIYHFHDPELLPVGVLLKLLKGKKVIYDVHEDYGKQMRLRPYLPKLAGRGVAWSVNLIEKFFAIFFDGVVTATDDILKNFSYHKTAVALRNFPILARFSEIKNGKPEIDCFNLIYVGGLEEIRGITQMVQTLEFLNLSNKKKVKLTLCGIFNPPSYEEKVRKLKGFEKVECLGWVDPHDIPKKIAQADVGIVCLYPVINYLTALPVKLFEYIAAGLPVIASNFPLWKEIVEGNKCGLTVDPLNPEEIARAIEYLVAHPELRKEMGENGRRAVIEKYNWEKESERLLELYGNLLDK